MKSIWLPVIAGHASGPSDRDWCSKTVRAVRTVGGGQRICPSYQTDINCFVFLVFSGFWLSPSQRILPLVSYGHRLFGFLGFLSFGALVSRLSRLFDFLQHRGSCPWSLLEFRLWLLREACFWNVLGPSPLPFAVEKIPPSHICWLVHEENKYKSLFPKGFTEILKSLKVRAQEFNWSKIFIWVVHLRILSLWNISTLVQH